MTSVDESVSGAGNAEILSIRRGPNTSPEGNLTRAEYLMWLGQTVNADVPLYNMIHTHRIAGAIDPEHFAAAWADVVAGSDTLRSTVVDRDGVPQVRVHESMDGALAQVDLSHHEDPDAALAIWIDARR
ncbi:MAG: hypothetical protein AAF081_06940, partial [Actinomycetota bacterium]